MAITVVGDVDYLPVHYKHIINWLAKARCKGDWVEMPGKGSVQEMPWGLHGISNRKCYTKFEDVVMSSWPNSKHCCVITGTPGIGKSTLLFYLLWKFMHKGLKNYQTVVYGDNTCLFYLQQDSTPGQWQLHLFDTKRGHEFKGLSLGLVDAPSDCLLQGCTLNDQMVVSRLCVQHLVIAASGGLLQKHSNLRKAAHQRHVLPAWQPNVLCHWCCQHCGLSLQEWEARVQLCGEMVPRLVMPSSMQVAWRDKFDSTLDDFIQAMLGITLSGLDAAPWDAHTLLILQPSPQLAEEPGEVLAGPKPGKMLSYVSAHVQREVHRALMMRRQLQGFLRAIPQAAPFAFEELVLHWLMKEGLTVQGGILKMKGECWLEDLLAARSEPKLQVLYRPRSRHPSIDAYTVLVRSKVRTLYFIQITTAAKHSRVQVRHVKALPSANAKSIVCLYVVLNQGKLKLKSGDDPLQLGTTLKKAKCREEVTQAEEVLAQYPDDIQTIIRGTSNDAGAVKRPAAARTGRPAKRLRSRPGT